MWRILSFPIHERSPAVVHLAVHLQNGQPVYFSESNVQQKALNPPSTTLTAFFMLRQNDSFAKKLLYSEVPTYYTWNANKKSFKLRKWGESFNGQPRIFKNHDRKTTQFIPIKMNTSFSACFWLMYPARRLLSI